MSEPDESFPDQERTNEVTVWRVGSFGTTLPWTAQEARQVGLALQELADRAGS